MDYSRVKKVVEVTSTSGIKIVNQYLDAGWIILQTASMTTDSQEYSKPVITYSLGWCLDGEPKEPS